MSIQTPVYSCLITGIGGQGTVLASRLLADCFMQQGLQVRTSETIGMSQRGGTVLSHLRIARSLSDIKSPLIPVQSTHLVIAFEPGEAARALPFLASGATMIAATGAQRPVTASLLKPGDPLNSYDGRKQLAYAQHCADERGARLIEVDPQKYIDSGELSQKALNIFLMGVALGSGALPLTAEEIKAALKARVKPQFHEMNDHALDLGEAYCHEVEIKPGVIWQT